MSFRDLIEDWPRPVLMYEVIPPPQSATREEVVDTAAFIRTLLADHDIDAINVPDVRNESRNGNRKAGFMQKRDPRQFALTIRDVFGGGIELVVNRCTVYETEAEQRAWLADTYTKFDIDSLVLVGGESSSVDYPGPSVGACTELAREVGRGVGTEPALGAITIPSRRREDLDEPERMLAKIQHGTRFFTSQVIFEPQATCKLLSDYEAACKEAGLEPVPIFLSFAPISGRKDARFLEWLGAHIPQPRKDWILATHGRPLDRSVRVAEHTLREVFEHVERRGIEVPIGVNVEHVMRYNFEASEVLLDRLSTLLEWREIEQRART